MRPSGKWSDQIPQWSIVESSGNMMPCYFISFHLYLNRQISIRSQISFSKEPQDNLMFSFCWRKVEYPEKKKPMQEQREHSYSNQESNPWLSCWPLSHCVAHVKVLVTQNNPHYIVVLCSKHYKSPMPSGHKYSIQPHYVWLATTGISQTMSSSPYASVDRQCSNAVEKAWTGEEWGSGTTSPVYM